MPPAQEACESVAVCKPCNFEYLTTRQTTHLTIQREAFNYFVTTSIFNNNMKTQSPPQNRISYRPRSPKLTRIPSSNEHPMVEQPTPCCSNQIVNENNKRTKYECPEGAKNDNGFLPQTQHQKGDLLPVGVPDSCPSKVRRVHENCSTISHNLSRSSSTSDYESDESDSCDIDLSVHRSTQHYHHNDSVPRGSSVINLSPVREEEETINYRCEDSIDESNFTEPMNYDNLDSLLTPVNSSSQDSETKTLISNFSHLDAQTTVDHDSIMSYSLNGFDPRNTDSSQLRDLLSQNLNLNSNQPQPTHKADTPKTPPPPSPEEIEKAHKLLTSPVDEDENTELHIKLINGQLKEATDIINQATEFSDINIENIFGQSPLHLAVLTKDPKIVRRLMIAGSVTYVQDSEGNTPLHSACMGGLSEIVRLLLKPVCYTEEKTNKFPYQIPFTAVPQDLTIRNNEDLTCLNLAAGYDFEDDIEELCEALGYFEDDFE